MEFTDYQCFQCRKMHYYLRKLVARYPDKIRITHCSFPMDQEFNPLLPNLSMWDRAGWRCWPSMPH